MSIFDKLRGIFYNKHISTASGAFDCEVHVNVSRFARHLDAAEYWLANEILQNSNDFVPFKGGTLRQLSHVIKTDDGYTVEWYAPYAHYQHEGIVYINPQHGASGWQDQYGQWHGWTGSKVPTSRKLVYHTAGTTDHWTKAARDAYMDHWISGARKVAGGHDA